MLHLAPITGGKPGRQLTKTLERFHLDFTHAPNFLRVLAKSPAATEAYTVARHALAGGHLTAREREQIALAVAEINDSAYCLVTHTASGRDAGLSEEDMHLARTAAANTPRAKAMLRFTQAVVLQRGHIGDEELHALDGAGFSEPEVIEIVATIALNIFTNYLNLASRTEVDFPLLHPECRDRSPAASVCG